jgi:PPK2 family polyphosphate:nucleotide phosphotransferase
MDIKRFRVRPGQKVDLHRHDPADTGGVDGKRQAQEGLERLLGRLVPLQEKLYAANEWALLVILQGMDTSGKDGVIKHVMSGLNPLGTQVYSFRRPSEEDLEHDFLWRISKALPERGRIGIFNRSHYEEVLVVRVHPQILESQRLPQSLISRRIWSERYEDIRAFEQHLARSGTRILKFFLHISKDEQARRLRERLDEPAKNWKFQIGDLEERKLWDSYLRAYEQALSNTSTKDAPWFIVPADHKWVTRLVVAEAIVEALESLHLSFPKPSKEHLDELEQARRQL